MVDLKDFLTSTLKLTDPGLVEAAAHIARIRDYKKGSIVLEPHEISNMYMFLVDGVLRTYYTMEDSGSEITEAVVIRPGSCCTPGPDLSAPQPAGVQALTDSKIVCFPFDDVKSLGERYPEVSAIIYQYITKSWNYITELKRIQYEMTTKQRWLWFTEIYPGIDKVMKLQDIASFLNMTLGNLSRVRKQLADEQTEAENEKGT